MNNTSGPQPDTLPARPLRRHYFARRTVYPWERPSLMRKHIYTGAMGNIWLFLVSGLFFIYFARTIGMSRFQFGLMAGISSWVIVFQLVSAAMTERTVRRKVLWFWLAIAGRVVRFGGVLISFGLWHTGRPHAAVVLIVGVCVANLFFTMAIPPWLSWLADIIPRREHGRFWGRRGAWIAFSVIAVMVPAGFVVDRIPEEHKIRALVCIFGLATVIGILDVLIHGTIPEPRSPVTRGTSFRAQVLEPLRDRRFRPWLTFNACWTFAMTFGGVLATIYFVEDLGISRNFLGGAVVLTGLTLAGTMVTGAWSGKLVDRLGVRRVLQGAHLVWSFLPAFWIFATPATALLWLGAGSIVGGTSSTAGVTAANKLITRFPRPERRAMYVAVSTTIGRLAGGAGVMLAGALLDGFEGRTFAVLGRTLSPFQMLFVVSLALRLAATLILIPRIHGPADEGAADADH